MSKSDGLSALDEWGLPVPPWTVVWTSAPDDVILAAHQAVADQRGLASVRSSAAPEDGSTSFAGQFASFLDVTAADVVQRVRDVAASYGSEPAHDYAAAMGEGRTDGSDVIVQRMVDATISGVVFSVNPAGIADEIILTVGAGAGAGVADQTPTTTAYLSADGQAYVTGSGPDLDARLRDQLVENVRTIAARWGRPVDVEFAVDQAGDLWILQARPVPPVPGATLRIRP